MIRLELPTPPSLNNLFRNDGDGGRKPTGRYAEWRRIAATHLWLGYKRTEQPVNITITVEDKGRRDLDNCAKAVLDFCVAHRIILNDDRKIVREITMRWGDIDGCIVEINPIADIAAK